MSFNTSDESKYKWQLMGFQKRENDITKQSPMRKKT